MLVADGGEPGLRLSTPRGRLDVGARRLQWAETGADVPLDDVPAHPGTGPALGPDREQLPPPAAPDDAVRGLVATAARLALTSRTGDAQALEADSPGGPRVGTGRDLMVTLRVQAAVQESLERGRWVEVG